MSAVLQRQTVASTAAPGPAETLPAWTYNNAEFFALEKEQLFLATWQLVCHENEVPNAGDYATLEVHGERALGSCARSTTSAATAPRPWRPAMPAIATA
jgi:hypothetical protein